MTTWYKQAIYCTTESSWVYDITESQTLLNVCPHNNTHTVNITGAYIYDSISETKVQIDQYNGGGFFTNHGRSFIAQACPTGSESIGFTTRDYFDYDMQMSILNGKFDATPDMEGDIVYLRLIPKTDTMLGIITATAALGDTSVSVYSSVFPILQTEGSYLYLFDSVSGRTSEKMFISNATGTSGAGTVTFNKGLSIDDGQSFSPNTTYIRCLHNCFATVTTGHPVKLYSKWIYITSSVLSQYRSARWIRIFKDGSNFSDLRMITELDTNNSRVKILEPFDIELDPSSGTIYVQLFIKTMHNRKLQPTTQIRLGENVTGGTLQPKGVGVVAEYTRFKNTPIEVIYSFEAFM